MYLMPPTVRSCLCLSWRRTIKNGLVISRIHGKMRNWWPHKRVMIGDHHLVLKTAGFHLCAQIDQVSVVLWYSRGSLSFPAPLQFGNCHRCNWSIGSILLRFLDWRKSKQVTAWVMCHARPLSSCQQQIFSAALLLNTDRKPGHDLLLYLGFLYPIQKSGVCFYNFDIISYFISCW